MGIKRGGVIIVAGAFFPAMLGGCERPHEGAPAASGPVYDTAQAKPMVARDRLEREALNREGGLKLVDRMMDRRTAPPAFERKPLAKLPADARVHDDVAVLDDREPFAEPPALSKKAVTIRVGIAQSTYRTREPEEVLSAVQPFIDLEQREVNVRGAADLLETDADIYNALLDGTDHMVVSHVFDYLRVREWLAGQKDNGAVLLALARPAHARVVDGDAAGTEGTTIELVVAGDSKFKEPKDLKGARLAMAAHEAAGPGTFLTKLLREMGQARGAAFFGKVMLRRYAKDAVIDVLKGKADAACVDSGTVGALNRFYGIGARIRTVAVSPRYNVDVLYTSLNNVATHRTEIELTQRQLTTLGKDPEGQEVLFFFDVEGWRNHVEGDIDVAERAFDDYMRFLNETPVELKALLDPKAEVDRKTYDRYGDE